MSNREYPDQPRVGVGAVVLREGRVLLVRRGVAPAWGLWAIPGGGLRIGETLQEGAEREILEETGIVIRAGALWLGPARTTTSCGPGVSRAEMTYTVRGSISQ